MIQERLDVHGVGKVDVGLFKTYYWVHDIWEVGASKLEEKAGRDLGFSFFQIGRMERFYLYLRYLFFLRFKPWLLVERK